MSPTLPDPAGLAEHVTAVDASPESLAWRAEIRRGELATFGCAVRRRG